MLFRNKTVRARVMAHVRERLKDLDKQLEAEVKRLDEVHAEEQERIDREREENERAFADKLVRSVTSKII